MGNPEQEARQRIDQLLMQGWHVCDSDQPTLLSIRECPFMHKQHIQLYTSTDGQIQLEVKLEHQTIWLTQKQIGEVFETTPENVLMHLKNVYNDRELPEPSTTKDFLVVRQEGKRQIKRTLKHYNHDAIISVGYRVNSACDGGYDRTNVAGGTTVGKQEVEQRRERLPRMPGATTIVRTFRDKLFTEIFPGREWVPKTLIFAKGEAERGEKVRQGRRTLGFRVERDARAKKVIATGTDSKAVEIVMFMRAVTGARRRKYLMKPEGVPKRKSRAFFEQMKGRGVRVMKSDDLQSVQWVCKRGNFVHNSRPAPCMRPCQSEVL